MSATQLFSKPDQLPSYYSPEAQSPPTQAVPLVPMQPLSRQQWQVLRCLGQGMACKEIARELSIAVGTVKNHIRQVISKLGAKNSMHAVAIALRKHIIY